MRPDAADASPSLTRGCEPRRRPGVRRPTDGGYDALPADHTTAKNTLVVGAVEEMVAWLSPASVVMSSFFAWGPTDDGRIKPDLVAPGVNTLSTMPSSTYGSMDGTSMAAPAVAGVVALVLEQHRLELGRPTALAATIKALLVHTAPECGPHDGPDSQFGWGLANAEGAALLIASAAVGDAAILEVDDFDGTADSYEIFPDPTLGALRITLAWADPPASPSGAVLDPAAIKLVNDLDVVLERESDVTGSSFYRPWILDRKNPSDPALTGDNDLDNVERIEPQGGVTPGPGETLRWFVHVSAERFSALFGPQPYSLCISGARR